MTGVQTCALPISTTFSCGTIGSPSASVDVKMTRVGKQVCVKVPSFTTGTCAGASLFVLSDTDMPVPFRPIGAQAFVRTATWQSNGTGQANNVNLAIEADGTLFYLIENSTAFVAGQTQATQRIQNFCYNVN